MRFKCFPTANHNLNANKVSRSYNSYYIKVTNQCVTYCSCGTYFILTGRAGSQAERLLALWEAMASILSLDKLFEIGSNILTLSPLAVNFEDRWWPLQTIWIRMKPHKMWGFIWDPNCLTFRLYISKKNGWKQWIFWKFWKKQIFEKITLHAKS